MGGRVTVTPGDRASSEFYSFRSQARRLAKARRTRASNPQSYSTGHLLYKTSMPRPPGLNGMTLKVVRPPGPRAAPPPSRRMTLKVVRARSVPALQANRGMTLQVVRPYSSPQGPPPRSGTVPSKDIAAAGTSQGHSPLKGPSLGHEGAGVP